MAPSAFDIVIVGGGIAGSSLGTVLARTGLAVLVVEREARFRDRVRGDGMFPWGVVEMTRLGLADVLPKSGARPLPYWQEYDDRTPVEPYDWRSDVPSGDVAWGLDHPGLQEALFAAAAAAGADTMRSAKAVAATPTRDGRLAVTIDTHATQTVVRARLVVGADGRDSGVRRWIGAQSIHDPTHHVIGGCLVDAIDLDPDAAHLARYPGGISLFFRRADGWARAYLVCQPEAAEAMRRRNAAAPFLATCAAAFPHGAFARVRAVGPVAFFPGIDVYPDRIAGEGIVLIGDAAGANDPSQGQGISLTFRDVRELRDLLLTQEWQAAIEEFARRRPTWYEPLRAYAIWEGPRDTNVGPAADAARARQRRAAERDPWRDGYGAIHALGPEGLPVTEAARRHYLGEDLDET
jgi:2-polyprenyl-6-methoxyphenol hydroxylase-like FAD-dependent oxidoreductase